MNTFGRALRITTFGESHGPGIGVVLDGLPSGVSISVEAIQAELDRRRPGTSPYTSPRREADRVEVLSGLYTGRTTGAPLALWIANTDARPADYAKLAQLYRPSHADFTYTLKYGHTDPQGGGRSSARETAARVAAGAVAQQFLQQAIPDLQILAWSCAIGPFTTAYRPTDRTEIERSPVRCPDPIVSAEMERYLAELQIAGDTTGGIIAVEARGVPPGLGEPIYDKLSARLAYAMLSINAARGFEIGEGFAAASTLGSVHNDPFHKDASGRIRPATNHAGGVLGGISTGEPLFFRVAFKPIATLRRPQHTVTRQGEEVIFSAEGRHDPCPVPRAVPIVEAMTALVLADFILLNRLYKH
ncbi:MAG: chorismate synthase [Bacteroidia bacterium]|nr:chorismate synthase [Bacteroidia bacterium]MDW8088954.1 chorismate synthase [Bacteroidia bacterium]